MDESTPPSPLLWVIPLPGHLSFKGQWTGNGPWILVTAEMYEEAGSFGSHQWTELCEWTESQRCGAEGGAGPGSPTVDLELRWAETLASRHPHGSPSWKGNYISPF